MEPMVWVVFFAVFAAGCAIGAWFERRDEDRASELLRDQVRWLQELLERRVVHEQRIERVQAGLPELEPREVKPRLPMPDSLKAVIALFPGEGAKALEYQARQLYDAGAPWEKIEQRYREDIESQAPGLLASLST